MSEIESTENFWCHQCQLEMKPLYVPNPACSSCFGDFVEKIEIENDPRDFIAAASEGEDDENDLNDQDTTYILRFLSNFVNSYQQQNNPNANNIDNSQRPRSPTGANFINTSTPGNNNNSEANFNANPDTIDSAQSRQSDSTGIQIRVISPGVFSGRTLDQVDGIRDNTEGTQNPQTQTNHRPNQSLALLDIMDSFRNPASATSEGPTVIHRTINIQPAGGPNAGGEANTDSTNHLMGNFINGGEDGLPTRLAQFLETLLNLSTNSGDYAFGPNGLDDIISQLMEQTGPNGPAPVKQEVLDALPQRPITKDEVASSAECAVCMDLYEVEENVTEIPCKHIYHPDCILPWLTKNGSCPVCRFVFPVEDTTTSSGETQNPQTENAL